MVKSNKTEKRIIRHKRVRAKIFGTASRPRLSVFRSNKYLSLQLVDDEKGKSLVQINGLGLKKEKKITKTEQARLVGERLAQLAKGKKIKKVVFDKGGHIYHGRIKAAAEGARSAGLEF